MKQFVILFLLFTISPISFTFAQNKIFCEIIEQIVSQKKTRIYLDYGQERNKKKDIRLENENEKAEIFYSRVEALNIMSALGWKSIWKQRKRIWQYIKYNSLLVE